MHDLNDLKTLTVVKDKPYFSTLDGIRGLAACVVFIHHSPEWFRPISFTHGYLAVDLFFMMSGFVLAHSYDSKMLRGYSSTKFLIKRCLRLYPLYFLGLFLGLLTKPLGLTSFLPGWILALMGLSGIPVLLSGATFIFPYNIPAWSLWFEGASNILYAILLFKLKTQQLVWLILCSGLCLSLGSLSLNGLDGGGYQDSFYMGFFRIMFSFLTGLVLYRHWQKNHLKPVHSDWLALGLLISVVTALTFTPDKNFSILYDLVATGLLFPVIIYSCATVNPGRLLTRLYSEAGAISYSLYILHWPLVKILGIILFKVNVPIATYSPYLGFTTLICLCLVSWLANQYYDQPVRQWLVQTLHTNGWANTLKNTHWGRTIRTRQPEIKAAS